MGYQPNVVSKGDIVIINNSKFLVKNDFNKQTSIRNRIVLEYIEEVREPVVHNAEIFDGNPSQKMNIPKPPHSGSNGVKRYEA